MRACISLLMPVRWGRLWLPRVWGPVPAALQLHRYCHGQLLLLLLHMAVAALARARRRCEGQLGSTVMQLQLQQQAHTLQWETGSPLVLTLHSWCEVLKARCWRCALRMGNWAHSLSLPPTAPQQRSWRLLRRRRRLRRPGQLAGRLKIALQRRNRGLPVLRARLAALQHGRRPAIRCALQLKLASQS